VSLVGIGWRRGKKRTCLVLYISCAKVRKKLKCRFLMPIAKSPPLHIYSQGDTAADEGGQRRKARRVAEM